VRRLNAGPGGRQTLGSAMRFLTLLACPLLLLAAERPVVPELEPLPDEQLFAVIVIQDLPAVAKKIDAVIASFNPKAREAGEMTVALERAMGADGLAQIGAGPVVIAIAQGGMAPHVVCIVPTAKAELLAEAMNGRRMKVEAVEGAVVISPAQGAGDLGARMAPLVADLAINDGQADIRFLFAPQRTLAAYAPMITPMIGMMKANMAKQPQTAQMLPILLAEIAGFRALGEQIEQVRVDISFSGDAITSRQVVVASEGSSLANALIEPPEAASDALAKRMGNDPGWWVMMGRIDMSAACEGIAETLGTMQADPDLAEMISDDMIDGVRAWGDFSTGSFAQRMRSTTEAPMLMDGVFGINNPEAYRAAIGAMVTTLFDKGPLAELYAKMGLSVTLDEAVRTSGELSVNRVSYHIDEAKADPAALPQMKATMRDVEYATPDGCAVIAQLPADLDRLIAGSSEVLTTTAARTIGPDRDVLGDFAIIPLARAGMRMQPDDRAKLFLKAIEALPTGEPMTFGWTAEGGRSLIEWRLPLKPLVDLTQAVRKVFEGGAPGPDEGGAERVF
jgi:hypothetical protein